MENKIRVLIAEDFDIIRRRFVEMINQTPDMVVVGETSSGQDMVRLASEIPSDIILMDMEMESMYAGAYAAEQIVANGVKAEIIFLTIHEADDHIFTGMTVGAVDYLIKTMPPNEILEHIRQVRSGRPSIDPKIQQRLLNEFSRMRRSEKSFIYFVHKISELTPAEKDLIHLLFEGKTVKQIAQIRSVEVVTVKTQIQRLLKKFGMHRTKDILALLCQLGMDRLF